MESTNEQRVGADSNQQLLNFSPDPPEPRRTPVAPAWHTVLLIAVIIAVSASGFIRHTGPHGAAVVNRLHTYGTTALLELVLIGWVALGVKLRGVRLRSLFGTVSIDLKAILVDFGVAIVFWVLSMMTLATVAMMWISVESWITHKPIPIQTDKSGKTTMPNPADDRAAKAVVQLAPTNGKEVAAWLMLCALVGVAEELVFRGYLQSQFTAWAKGAAAAGVVFSAVIFGAAHGYEGARAMFMLTVFGALFSLLALFRRNLRAGVFAHSWHDAVAGLTVALLHARHVL
jgi:membrane protease YdiL (CAAX protease family)